MFHEAEDPKLINHVSNIVLLCRGCHYKTEAFPAVNILAWILNTEFKDYLEITIENVSKCCGYDDDNHFDKDYHNQDPNLYIIQ